MTGFSEHFHFILSVFLRHYQTRRWHGTIRNSGVRQKSSWCVSWLYLPSYTHMRLGILPAELGRGNPRWYWCPRWPYYAQEMKPQMVWSYLTFPFILFKYDSSTRPSGRVVSTLDFGSGGPALEFLQSWDSAHNYGALVHRAFHYHSSIVLIWLK